MSRRNPLGPKPEDLRALRTAARLSQRNVAELVGVSRETVVRWERGRCPMPFAAWRLLELLVALKASRDAAAVADLVRRATVRSARIDRNRAKRRARGLAA